MGYQPLEKLLPKAGGSVYRLVRMASERAMELADGKQSLINTHKDTKTATVALEEILSGKVMLSGIPLEPPKGTKLVTPTEQAPSDSEKPLNGKREPANATKT